MDLQSLDTKVNIDSEALLGYNRCSIFVVPFSTFLRKSRGGKNEKNIGVGRVRISWPTENTISMGIGNLSLWLEDGCKRLVFAFEKVFSYSHLGDYKMRL